MDITAPRFTNEDKAREHLEAIRWPDGPFCPHCGSFDATRLEGKKHRAGLVQCNEAECRQQFTVTVSTVFERSKVPLHKWLPSRAYMVSASPIGGLTNSPPNYYEPPKPLGERRKRWTSS